MEYANPSEPVFRNRLIVGLTALASALDLTETPICKGCCRDQNFLRRMRAGDNFTLKKYDTTMAAISALWPAHVKWPDGFERHAPAIAPGLECDKLIARREQLEHEHRQKVQEARELLAQEQESAA